LLYFEIVSIVQLK